ncbi:MAG TPA: SGNH/GDSL hydrolase family protein [Geobacteraceae bacterium]|nr:SGNH/GDSL hydrolase family protein [Geobacteraceae bacterium]
MKKFIILTIAICMLVPAAARAELPWQFDTHTRYMAMGDSLTAGYGAIPATEGFVYLLYRTGVFDTVPNTLFCNAGVPGATSSDVLAYQVPQAIRDFRPGVITLTVGGNDLVRIMDGADPAAVLHDFQNNLVQIFMALRSAPELQNTKIFVGNLYSIPEIPASETIVPIFNQVVAGVAANFGVPVADVYSAFQGKNGLLLVERHGADPLQIHPTNAGYRVMAKAFEDVIPK